MNLAIVGSRKFKKWYGLDAAEGIIRGVLGHYQPKTVISGGAEGIDTMAADIAGEMGMLVMVFKPENNRWEPNGYKDRNMQIAGSCDSLLAIRCSESSSYGSGWTADYAEKIGKTVERVLL